MCMFPLILTEIFVARYSDLLVLRILNPIVGVTLSFVCIYLLNEAADMNKLRDQIFQNVISGHARSTMYGLQDPSRTWNITQLDRVQKILDDLVGARSPISAYNWVDEQHNKDNLMWFLIEIAFTYLNYESLKDHLLVLESH